ncbi:uncharacterized protein J4E92_007720 [Alternaria infectoria]|uniref:uncharacterized protein n=1 Tax=Alternaria infectoria TaxID=45303 RepID=UPI0022212ADD|nr:uncharacterized protein J4E92_007720 [Alternaria infectoria]KAI4923746.1 hypothetical protein J4E92_007720 [Alternaria infectoria]
MPAPLKLPLHSLTSLEYPLHTLLYFTTTLKPRKLVSSIFKEPHTRDTPREKSTKMARGNSPQTQVFYKGSSGDQFCIFVESVEELQKWKADSTIPMVDVVAGWKVLVPEHGKQGVLNTASKQQLENEFGKDAKEDDIFKKILQEGSVQSSEVC